MMRIDSKKEMARYAMDICLPLMQRTANRRAEGGRPLVNDGAGYLLGLVEAFCRPLWGLGPILNGKEKYYINIKGESTEVCQWIRSCILDATDEKSPYNWNLVPGMDHTSYYNQMKTELAGLMVGIYFARDTLWEPFSKREKTAIADWIYDINLNAYQMVWDCNHIWFIMLCLTILEKLGFVYDKTRDILNEGLERLDKMYVEKGFYQDGKFGRFDYYNPWAMHTYPLLWCVIADDSFDRYEERRREYRRRTDELLNYYSHMFETSGCHVPFGRSLAYRFAASGIFPAAAMAGCSFDCGLSREITLRNISFFAEKALAEDGILPPGFLYEAPQTVETYTSDGGAYWCCKAFLALLLPDDHAFWQSPSKALPADGKPFLIQSGSHRIHMPLVGSVKTGVTLYNNTANYLQDNNKTQWFLDMAGFYSKFAYNTRAGFGISTRDEVSADNMIVLLTPDGTMESHRMGFEDLGTEMDGRVLSSRHTPFANDETTYIRTKILILNEDTDVRIHKVVLNQRYRVREGGFCVPCKTDKKDIDTGENYARLKADGFCSAILATGTVPQTVQIKSVTPGMHLLAPMASYPMWQTDLLEKGEYLFATVCMYGDSLQEEMPVMNYLRNGVEVKWQKETLLIEFNEKDG